MRAYLLLASALSAGAAFGRKHLQKSIRVRKSETVSVIAEEVRARIKDKAHKFLRESFRNFAVITACKLFVLTGLWGLLHTNVLGRSTFGLLVALSLGLFLARDILVSWPFMRLGITELSRHGWKPRKALSEVVAAKVFDDVLSEAQASPASRSTRILLMLAGESYHGVQRDIATQVARIAHDTTWSDLRPFLVMTGLKTAALLAIYSAAVFAILA